MKLTTFREDINNLQNVLLKGWWGSVVADFLELRIPNLIPLLAINWGKWSLGCTLIPPVG